jgi:outer membrane protein assembly factor BamE (lipoprotein component of BamABCDE complex)
MNLSKWLTAAATTLSAAVLPACDGLNLQELKPGISTAAEVRARMGLPAAEYTNADGSITYEYNRQPNGTNCYMITIGSDQIMQRIEQVLTEANFARVQPGMSRKDIRRLLGTAGMVTPYPANHEEVWDWRVAGTIPTEEAHFHVHFDTNSGLVTKTTRRVEVRG